MKGLKSVMSVCNRFCFHNLSKYQIQRSRYSHRHFSHSSTLLCNFQDHIHLKKGSIYILGIETSCDDTGAAIVDEHGQILGEGFYSQVKASVKFGGVLPSVAGKYHEDNIEKAVCDAFTQSGLVPENLTAIAVTVKPGNIRALRVGCNFGKEFALRYKLPLIPIHHMEAHALTVRMNNQVEFPFVVLLVSGGHCILAIAHSVDEWSIIGETLDSSPGVTLDQVARRMKIRNLPGMGDMIGGKAIEHLAKNGNPRKFPFPIFMMKHRDSNFSFSGLESSVKELVNTLEKEKGIEGGRVLDMECLSDLCASFQYSLVDHMIRRTKRGLRFAEYTNRIPEEYKTLVISGGVASNMFLRSAFEILCKEEGYRLFIPPPKLCTDNGIMIAWNGIERWKTGKGILYNEDEIKAVKEDNQNCKLGPNLSEEIRRLELGKLKSIKIV